MGSVGVDPLDHRRIELPSGATIEIRPTTAEDSALIEELYDGLTSRDLHRRFFSAFRPAERWCREWASVSERSGYGLVAILSSPEDPTGQPIGEAGYALRSDGDGDLAVTVAADRRGWLGGYLLDCIVEHAHRSGVENLQAEVLLENRSMLSLLRHRGAVDLEHADGMVRVSIATDGGVPTWPPLEDRPRVVVEVAGSRWAGEAEAERAGLAVAVCSGPDRRRGGCPVLDGDPCPLVEGADAVVVVLDPGDDTTQELVRAHVERHPGLPVVVRRTDRLPDELASRVVPAPADVSDVVRQVVDACRPPGEQLGDGDGDPGPPSSRGVSR